MTNSLYFINENIFKSYRLGSNLLNGTNLAIKILMTTNLDNTNKTAIYAISYKVKKTNYTNYTLFVNVYMTVC